MIETLLIIVAVGLISALNFLLGARTTQKASRGEEIKLPTVNPMEIKNRHTEKIEAEKEEIELNTMLENINNYNGTALGQKNIG